MPTKTKVALLWKITKPITQQAPFPFGKRRAEPVEAGGGIGPSRLFELGKIKDALDPVGVYP